MNKAITFIIIVLTLVVFKNYDLNAQGLPEYKAWHINQNFDGIAEFNGKTPILGVLGETLPPEWSWSNSKTNYFTNAAGYYFVSTTDSTLLNAFNWRGGGSGGRGGELRFPSTLTSEDADSTVWYVEFDWTSKNAGFNSTGKNTISLMLSGSNSKNYSDNEKKGDTWYGDTFFLLYAFKPDTISEADGGPGYLHLVNLDPEGEPATVKVTDDDGNVIRVDTIPGAFLRPFHSLGGSSDLARFRRAGNTWQEVDSLNLSTKTQVKYIDGSTYHLKLKLNLETQLIETFEITEINNPSNSQVLTDIPFLAPNFAGRNSIVPIEERIIRDISRIEGFSLRTTQLGAGGNSNFDFTLDNLEVYVMKPSKGIRDVTVSYIDRDGNTAKPARMEQEQQVGFRISLLTDDKQRFSDDNYYYAYDEEATHAANVNGEDGESLTVETDTPNTLYVVFKKSPKVAGTYVWSGASSINWSELEENFSVNGSTYSYQVGNPVAFSDNTILNKEVSINEPIQLGDASVTIAAPDYEFTGSGSVISDGVMNIDAPTSIGVNASTMKGGAVLNTNEITLKSLTPLSKLKLTQDNSIVKFDAPSGSLNLNVEGQGGTVNYEAYSNTIYNVKTQDASVINILLKVPGARSANYWAGGATSHPRDAQINVLTDIQNSMTPVEFSAATTMFDSTRVYLGDNIRLIRHFNEAASGNDRLKIGELTGSPTSYIEAGFVNGRAGGYEIGSLGTDAVFDGSIRPWLSKIEQGAVIDSTTMEREPETYVWSNSGLRIDKVGTGTWVVNGTVTFPEVTSTGTYNYIYVKEGTLVLNNKIYFSDYITKASSGVDSAVVAPHAITVYPDAKLVLNDEMQAPAVNLITLKVESGGTLECHNNYVGAYNVDILGDFKGGVQVANSFAAYDGANVSMYVNSFDSNDYDVIEAQGDITVLGSTLNITVNASEAGQSIPMIYSMSNMDLSFSKVLVNGEDITDFTPETPGAKYVWYYDEGNNAGTLMSLVHKTGVESPQMNKVIKDIQYYNIMGHRIRSNSMGLVIKKIIFDDNTYEIQKQYRAEN